MSRIVRGGETFSLTIAASGTTTAAVCVLGYVAAQVLFPSAMTSTSVAVHGCDDPNGTFVAILDKDGNAIAITPNASKLMQLPPEALGGSAYIKLVGGSSEASERALKLYCKG